MSESLLDCVEVEPRRPAAASVIWLHGLGADGHDFEPIVPELGLGDAAVRFVFPHAPPRPVTINGGMRMRAWYDLTGIGADAPQDEAGIEESRGHVEALIRRERERGVEPASIVVAGFSQGGAVALHTGLRYPERLAGVMGLSTYLPVHWRAESEASEANADTPLFMAHGRYDPVLPYQLGEGSRQLLEGLGYTIEWHDYRMEHAVCPEEIGHIADWLKRVLNV